MSLLGGVIYKRKVHRLLIVHYILPSTFCTCVVWFQGLLHLQLCIVLDHLLSKLVIALNLNQYIKI